MIASVVIITKNQKGLLQKTLPTLLNQERVGKYEIIVVDSGSTDGAVEYVESLPVRLVKIDPEKFQYAKAFNTGAKLAKGDYLIRLSGDVVPIRHDFIYQMTDPFKEQIVGGVYGKYTITKRKGVTYPDYWNESRFPKQVTRYTRTPTLMMGVNLFGFEFGEKATSEEVFNLAGGCCAIRRKTWKQRPFNERLIAGEDAEYAYFLHLIKNDIVFNPEAVVVHEHTIKVENKKPTWHRGMGLSKWQWVFNREIANYWVLKSIGLDPYAKLLPKQNQAQI